MTDSAFSRSLAQPVRVLEHIELWGQIQVRVWVPGQDRVVLLPADDLASADGLSTPNPDRLVAIVAAARLREAFAGEALAAPLDAKKAPGA